MSAADDRARKKRRRVDDRAAIARLAPGYHERSSEFSQIAGWLVYISVLFLLAGLLPPEVFVPGTTAFLLIMGALGIWRYSWAALHFARSWLYQRWSFPRIRERADAIPAPPRHLYFVVTSFRMSAEMNALVYKRLVEEIMDYGGVRATIVACVTDPADIDVLKRATRRAGGDERARLIAVAQRGRGKRDAMAEALELIAAQTPPPGSQVILMDGDTLLERGCLRKACSVLQSEPDIGAATTENQPLVIGGAAVREWYRLRMAQRHNLMCSLSLSRKVLVLTGRFSVFRADIACRADFILAVRRDYMRHWRLGKIYMLTGDDKSTWFTVLKARWNMLYVPDAIARPLEEPPQGGFFAGSLALMNRWFGNMVRNNGRALALGPRHTGLFLWVCLLDQRISMYTTLVGPTFAALAAAIHSHVFVLIYLFWVAATRGVYCLLLFINSGRLHPLFPAMLYYSQLFGSLSKVFMTFYPFRQKWTRQKIATRQDPLELMKNLTSGLYSVVSGALFILFVGWASNILEQSERRIVDDARIGGVERAATRP